MTPQFLDSIESRGDRTPVRCPVFASSQSVFTLRNWYPSRLMAPSRHESLIQSFDVCPARDC
jgi:hypothetical protein